MNILLPRKILQGTSSNQFIFRWNNYPLIISTAIVSTTQLGLNLIIYNIRSCHDQTDGTVISVSNSHPNFTFRISVKPKLLSMSVFFVVSRMARQINSWKFLHGMPVQNTCNETQNEWIACFRPQFCNVRLLGRGQPGLMRWILVWIMPQVQDWLLNLLTRSPVSYHCATTAPSAMEHWYELTVWTHGMHKYY